MIGWLDFSLAPTLLFALLVGAALPISLAIVARVSALSGRNALQFLMAFLVMIALWIALVVGWRGWKPLDLAEICVGLMILGAESLLYLNVWGLLSRGYTLGLVLTLYRAERPLNEEELARSYRGGQGLSWIMGHRLSGLIGAGLVQERDGMVTLTPSLGVPMAWLYKLSLAVLGLKRTG